MSLWAGAPATVELKGIVRFPENPELARMPAGRVGGGPSVVALIEFSSRPESAGDRATLLGEGQRQGDVEVLKIDAGTGTVHVKIKDAPQELVFASAAPPEPTVPSGNQATRASTGSIRLENARWGDVLAIYQQLVGRTLLCSGAIDRTIRANLRMNGVATAEEMAKGIEGTMQGLMFHNDGDKFTVVGRKGDFEKLTPELREVSRTLNPREVVPAGMLTFQNTDLSQVLQIFQELVNRTLLRPALLPGSTIYLKTQTPMTREEAVYAMCAVFALNGISFVDLGDKFLFAYPSFEEAKRKALLARKLPSHESAKTQTIPAGMVTASFDLTVVAKIYAELSGQPVELDQDLPPRRLVLHSQTPLMSGDVLYAFDLLLGWEGLEVVKNKDGTGLRLTRVP